MKPDKNSQKNKRNLAVILVSCVIAMLSLAYAAVPLYQMFCERTGYNGTTKILTEPAHLKIGTRQIKVQFNSDVHPELPWHFETLQKEMTVHVGENALAFYRVKNESSEPIVGWAIYNVTPTKASQYFVKVHCFCFDEQKINAHETLEMPVSFFIDPAIDKDPDLKDVKTLTLSYTFFKYKEGFKLKTP